MYRILFVCLGNICRSPMAEAVFAHKVKQSGLSDKIEVDSAGTGDWHSGAAPHFGTQRVLEQNGIDHSHRARSINKTDYDNFDLILTMDDDNYAVVTRHGRGKATIKRFLDFAPNCGYTEVPDPYYSGNFTQTFELVSEAADGLLEWVREKLEDGS